MADRKVKFSCIAYAIIFTVILSGCAFKGPYRCYLGMYHGRIYDLDTNEPIEGVVVHVAYHHYGASAAGAIGTEVAVRETLTDASGGYLIPADTVMHKCFSGKLQGYITIFKPGYGTIGKSKLTCPDEEKEKIFSYHKKPVCVTKAGKYLIWGLPKLKTKEERRNNMPSRASRIPIEEQILLMQAINQERHYLGYDLFPLPEWHPPMRYLRLPTKVRIGANPPPGFRFGFVQQSNSIPVKITPTCIPHPTNETIGNIKGRKGIVPGHALEMKAGYSGPKNKFCNDND